MQDTLSKIPTLEDHQPYRLCCEKIADLEGQLTAARADLINLGDGPIPSWDDGQEDIDLAISRHFKQAEAHEKAKTKATLKVSALERALRLEQEKAPHLRAEAEEAVGRSAAELHKPVLENLYRLKQEMSDALTLETAIRAKIRHQCGRRTPGCKERELVANLLGADQRFCRVAPIYDLLPRAASELVINDAVVHGQQQYKSVVADPKEKEFRGLAHRFQSVLKSLGVSE